MKFKNTLYENQAKFQAFLEQHEIVDGSKILVQVFTGIVDEQYISATISSIVNLLPSATIIGATTGGEIIEGKVTDNQTVVSITEFQNTTVDSIIVSETDSFEAGKLIASQIVKENTKVLILFSDGFFTLPNPLFDGIRTITPDVLIGGGMAGDNGLLKNTLVYLNGEITNNGVVGVSLNSDALVVRNFHKLNWRPVGKKMKITEANGNMLSTVNGMLVTDLYRKYLGDEIADGLPHTAALYPLVKEKDGFPVSRILFSFNEDGSANYTGNMVTGEQVRFAYADIEMILDNDYIESLDAHRYEAAYIYSCMSRKIILKEEIEMETRPIAAKISMAGFFTYGEFFSLENSTEVLNETMTMLFLNESKQNREHINNVFSADVGEKTAVSSTDTILKAITHLTDVVSAEIEDAYNHIQGSINYASRIQRSILPSEELVQKVLPNHFLLWEPRDVVGGDIYWIYPWDDGAYIILGDCTGHGVPGAFMTLISNGILEHSIDLVEAGDCADLLAHMQTNMLALLAKGGEGAGKANDGIEVGVVYLPNNGNALTFAGARFSLFYHDCEGDVVEVKGNKKGIGFEQTKKDIAFNNISIERQQGRRFVMTSDGLIDQVGGEKRFMMGKKRFKSLLLEAKGLPINDVGEFLFNAMEKYRGEETRRDDVSAIGFE